MISLRQQKQAKEYLILVILWTLSSGKTEGSPFCPRPVVGAHVSGYPPSMAILPQHILNSNSAG